MYMIIVCFSARERESYTHYVKPRATITNALFPLKVLSQDEDMYNFLYNFEKYGLSILTGVPKEVGNVARLTSALGFVKRTHYG